MDKSLVSFASAGAQSDGLLLLFQLDFDYTPVVFISLAPVWPSRIIHLYAHFWLVGCADFVGLFK